MKLTKEQIQEIQDLKSQKYETKRVIAPDLEKISRGHFGIIYEKNERKNIQLRSVYKRNSNYLNQLNVWNDQDLPIKHI